MFVFDSKKTKVFASKLSEWKRYNSTQSGGTGGSVAEWSANRTQAQKGPGSNRSRDAVG